MTHSNDGNDGKCFTAYKEHHGGGHGGAGYISEYAVERFYRDVRLFRLYEGTSQIQQIIIARNLIKEAS